MPAVVQPITVFEKTIDRSLALLELHSGDVELGEKDDLVRAAVILAIAGFDRYFTAKYCDVLIPHLKSGKKVDDELCKRLEDSGLSTRFALEFLTAKRPYRKIRTIVQNSLSAHTTHRDSVIDALFLQLGLKGLCEHAQAKAKRKNLIKRTMKLGSGLIKLDPQPDRRQFDHRQEIS